MIRWSDNAASDEMLQRVGGPAPVAAFARRIGMRRQDELMPILGEFVAWSKQRPEAWAKLGPHARAVEAAAYARATTREVVATLDESSIADQRGFARSTPAGSPRDWAQLMENLHTAGGLRATASAIVRKHLGWPLELSGPNRERFVRFGAKGGSLIGLVTESMFVEPKGRPAVAIALFLKDLSQQVDDDLRRSFVHQQFLLKLAEDDAFWSETAARLG